MGTTSQGSRQAKHAIERAESDPLSAGISVLFRNRVPQTLGDDLDEGWDDEESSSPSAIGEKLPTAALAPARVPAFLSASLTPLATSEWPSTPMSRAPAVPEDDSEWDLPSTPNSEETVLASCVRELAPSSSRESADKRQLQRPSSDSSPCETLDSTTSAVSAPPIDITIEPTFQGTTAEPKLSVESASSPDLTEVLSGPRSSRSTLARRSDRATSRRTRWWVISAAVVVTALGGATYLALPASLVAPFKIQDPAATAPIPWLPHLAIPSPPALDVPSPAPKSVIDEPKQVTSDSLDAPQTNHRASKPIARRRVRTSVPRPRPVDPVAPIAVIAEPASASSTAAPIGVVDNMIAAPAPKAVEPLQEPPALRSGTADEPLSSHLSK